MTTEMPAWDVIVHRKWSEHVAWNFTLVLGRPDETGHMIRPLYMGFACHAESPDEPFSFPGSLFFQDEDGHDNFQLVCNVDGSSRVETGAEGNRMHRIAFTITEGSGKGDFQGIKGKGEMRIKLEEGEHGVSALHWSEMNDVGEAFCRG
ncbi:MAG: hypothetical protein Q9220_001147 [cf. Caloplaca sp. 1 TL-2023]